MENLLLADAKACKGKRRSRGVQRHLAHREADLLQLQETLRSGQYKVSPYHTFTLTDKGKERVISCLPHYPDHIVQHAIVNILAPIWQKTFPHNTYACIKGRGITACAERVKKDLRHFTDAPKLYCLKIDVVKFYPSVNHDVLKAIIRRKIKDVRLLRLIDTVIDSADGLPIGNYLSQFLANLYLCYFLHFVNEELPVMLRADIRAAAYADDIVFLCPDKRVLHAARAIIGEYLETRLKLKIKGNWAVFPLAVNRYDKHGRGIDYVGFVFYREQTCVRKCIKTAFRKQVNALGKCSYKSFITAVAPRLGWFIHSDSRHALYTIINNNNSFNHYASILRQRTFKVAS